jgi:hypothetical protein
MAETADELNELIFIAARNLLLWDAANDCQSLYRTILEYDGTYPLLDATFRSCLTNITTPSNPLSITPTYTNFDQAGYSNTILTGVRAAPTSGEVYISGWSYDSNSGSGPSFIYEGPLDGTGTFTNNFLFPSSTGVTVNGTSLYGPNNQDDYGAGVIRVVGNYATEETGEKALGCYYQGVISTSAIESAANWNTLDPSSLTSSTVISAIAHSTMGNLIVGNYDDLLIQGKTFIYNVATGLYYALEYPESISLTAYGVWQNSASNYTITGGLSMQTDVDTGYLVDWDTTGNSASNWRFFHYNNNVTTAFVTHFEGITGPANDGFSYNMVSDIVDKDGEARAVFVMDPYNVIDSNFSEAVWIDYSYPDSIATSANTVYENNAIGVYIDSDGIVHSYVAAFTAS